MKKIGKQYLNDLNMGHFSELLPHLLENYINGNIRYCRTTIADMSRSQRKEMIGQIMEDNRNNLCDDMNEWRLMELLIDAL